MNAIDVNINDDSMVSVNYEPIEKEKVKLYLNELKNKMGVTWFGVCPIFDLEPTNAGARVMRRWYSNGKDFRPMPIHHWKTLLIMLKGQEPINCRTATK